MSLIIFAGPSISAEQITAILPDADVRPPAKQGDIYLATQDKPQVIALIDGFFERIPAVWHKEILYAMSLGIHVYGSSSMGALRAAELDVFGMVGIGKIYRQYTSGALEDDDEVALIHAPEHLNYQPVSRAMVDLRDDLQRACAHELLSRSQADDIERQLKALWYPYRTLSALEQFAESVLSACQLETLHAFFNERTVSLKHQDALELVQTLAALDLPTLAAKQVDYQFCENDAWQTLVTDVEREQQFQGVAGLDPAVLLSPAFEQSAKLKSDALAHAKLLGLNGQPWIRPAFMKVAGQWHCVKEDGQPDFEQISYRIHLLNMKVEQFDQWIECEALLMAYVDQVQRAQADSHL
ncbi:TfuA-like protein [Photobacterium atrarenae]|uniref:TfuA-like protein n=1 Tax=Photobacterium atrarenae TaxID=865757 RepID=A0ABY5GQ80_9GAMM|nr:TfuA-like protein [Photobacterium atrarenae]UTV30672.1 TfuA-like protein [Photobacterium atrarenae]